MQAHIVQSQAARPARAARQEQRPTPLAQMIRVLVGALFRLVFRIRVQGQEHIPPGPCVFCINHLGWSDPFLLLLFLPARPRLLLLGLHPRAISAFRAWVGRPAGGPGRAGSRSPARRAAPGAGGAGGRVFAGRLP